MDPVSLIVAALVAGLTAGVSDTTKTAVADTYQALKARLMPKVENNEDAKNALVALEKKPDSEGRQLSLKEEFTNLNIDQDTELVHMAQAFLERIDEIGAQSGKYVINIQNAHGMVIGDNNSVKQTFTNKPLQN
jgi:hypothetical protein